MSTDNERLARQGYDALMRGLPPPGHDETANLLRFRDGKVIAMHDYRSRQEAMAALRGGPHGE
jgi:hypothetical protein